MFGRASRLAVGVYPACQHFPQLESRIRGVRNGASAIRIKFRNQRNKTVLRDGQDGFRISSELYRWVFLVVFRRGNGSLGHRALHRTQRHDTVKAAPRKRESATAASSRRQKIRKTSARL